TIALADEVVYLEHGRVVARGHHRELLRTVPGYADLVTAYERADAEREREHIYDEAAIGPPTCLSRRIRSRLSVRSGGASPSRPSCGWDWPVRWDCPLWA